MVAERRAFGWLGAGDKPGVQGGLHARDGD
jgi:hypothetical protein